VLHELGAQRCAGFDLANRCAAGLDALWIAKALVESGTHKTVAVCCADRFDHVLGPKSRPARTPFDAVYAAGASTAIVSAQADNTLAGYAHYTNPRLGVHCATGPWSGGSRAPLDRLGFEAGHHQWQVRLSVRDLDDIARYEREADRHNYPSIMKQAGVDGFDLVACSPFDPGPQLEVLHELGIDPGATLFTVPRLGHIGPADLFLIVGIAVASGRLAGNRVAMSMRTSAFANALALVGAGSDAGIRVAGQGVDWRLWQAATSSRPLAEEHTT
jgi:3-oxoacyl-[acyl-carrier-protein] synthase III